MKLTESYKKRLQKLAGAVSIPFTKTEQNGITFETGTSVTFPFNKFRDNSGKTFKDPNDAYQQAIEPTGNYLSFNPIPFTNSDGHMKSERGQITFKNPLVIKFNVDSEDTYDSNSWKSVLANHYKKTGRSLSKAIIADGYDGIVTVFNDGHIGEIVGLTNFR